MENITDVELWKALDDKTRELYHEVMKEAVQGMRPVIRILDSDTPNEKELLIAFRNGTTHSYFSGITDL